MLLEVLSHGKNATDPTLFIVVCLFFERNAEKKLHNGVGRDGEKWNYKDHIFIYFDLVC